MSKPNESEINDVLDSCMDSEDEGGSKWPGMTYEQGVSAAVNWMTGDGNNPMED